MKKSELRKIIKKKRDAIPAIMRSVKSHVIAGNLKKLEAYKECDTVLLYASIQSEVITKEIIVYSLNKGKKVYLPVTDRVNAIDSTSQASQMEFYRIYNVNELTPGNYGVPEPSRENEKYVYDSNENAIIIVPGLVFDKSGNRYGYGKGYYDCFLQDKELYKIGLAYDFQLLNHIKAEDLDVKMNVVLTEKTTWTI